LSNKLKFHNYLNNFEWKQTGYGDSTKTQNKALFLPLQVSARSGFARCPLLTAPLTWSLVQKWSCFQ
jgi:hypothetical protein